jgi:tetratricopeptide (TPR) repeat protein
VVEAYQERGNLPGSLAFLSSHLDRAPQGHDARFQHGLLVLALAQPDVAADDFSRVLAAEPDLERARYRRAQVLIRLGRHRNAVADLDALIATDRNDYALYQLRGIVREALGDQEPARADRERASALLPKTPLALNNRAWVLATGPIDQRDPERAVTLARRSVELAPGRSLSLNALVVALYRAGQYAQAVSVLEQSLTAEKGEFDAFDLYFLAMARYKLGQIAEGRLDFDRAVQWRRDHPNQPAQYATELDAFQAEAEALLNAPPLELPANVFAPSRP